MSEQVKRETAKERRHRKLVQFHDALLSYPTVTAAAAASGICARTATRWLHSQEFKDIYVNSRQATLESAAALPRASSTGSIEALASIVRDPEAASTARVAAAGRILDVLLRITEAQEFETRLAKLERCAAEVNE